MALGNRRTLYLSRMATAINALRRRAPDSKAAAAAAAAAGSTVGGGAPVTCTTPGPGHVCGDSAAPTGELEACAAPTANVGKDNESARRAARMVSFLGGMLTSDALTLAQREAACMALHALTRDTEVRGQYLCARH